jgi:hypothetical protein
LSNISRRAGVCRRGNSRISWCSEGYRRSVLCNTCCYAPFSRRLCIQQL